jgi:hypothetical protein
MFKVLWIIPFPTSKILNFNFMYDFSFLLFISYEMFRQYVSNRFDLALVVSEIKGVKGANRDKKPK